LELNWIKLIVTIVLTIFGWIAVGWINAKRDKSNKRRELVVEHLINAYRILAQEIAHRELTPENRKKFENLMAEIQLFGSKEQIELAKKISLEIEEKGVSEIDPLVDSLRSSLRKELLLEEVNDKIIWLRFKDDFKKDIGKSI